MLLKYDVSLKCKGIKFLLKRRSFLRKPENLEIKREILQHYLNYLLELEHVKHHKIFMQFLEISHLTFILILGMKNKECLAKIKLKEYNTSCMKIENMINNNCKKWKKLWISIKYNNIALIDPNTAKVILCNVNR